MQREIDMSNTRRLGIAAALCASALVASGSAAAADDFELQVKNVVESTGTLTCPDAVLEVTTAGWFQLHTDGADTGIRVTTFRQTQTYTNPDSGKSLVVQSVGVARVYYDETGTFDHAEVAGHSNLTDGSGDLIYGLQDVSGAFAAGHVVSPCEVIG